MRTSNGRRLLLSLLLTFVGLGASVFAGDVSGTESSDASPRVNYADETIRASIRAR